MTKISRRAVIVGSLAVPLAAPTIAPLAAGTKLQGSDPLVAAASAWMAEDDRREAMIRNWQGLESDLFDKAHAMKMNCAKACRSNMPEARAMRALNREIEASFNGLVQAAEQASLMKARTVEGAIAKIELGLAVQGPFDWQDHALELVQDGLAELRALRPV